MNTTCIRATRIMCKPPELYVITLCYFSGANAALLTAVWESKSSYSFIQRK